MPKMYIIAGCNGSGKTTASYTLLPELLDCREFVNSDEFAKSLSPFDPSAASISASRYMLMKIKYLIERKQDFSVETTLATRFLAKIIREAQSKGYFVTILYFWVNSIKIAVDRVQARVDAGGHNVVQDVIARRYHIGLKYFFDTYVSLCDRWVLADNSIIPFTVVAEGTSDLTFIKDNEKYRKIREILANYEEQHISD